MAQASGKVVLVTGASRGLGRGMARQFGRLGHTVYITSRPESGGALDEVAAEVRAAGGIAMPLPTDHRDDNAVEALLARIRDEAGRLDILVNNAAAVHDALIMPGGFWQKPLALVDMIDVGLRSAYVASFFAAPLMIASGGGLIANISFYGAVSYFHGPAYGAAKGGTDKMSFDMAVDLQPHDVACVAFWPGFIYTDRVAQIPSALLPPEIAANLPNFERPEFSALVIDALHRDPERMALSGHSLIGAELGIRYDIPDIDGKRPISYRSGMGEPARFLAQPNMA